jgi:hypothetical protein
LTRSWQFQGCARISARLVVGFADHWRQTVKGLAAKMYAELGIRPSALAVARHHCELLTVLC